jgi:hypothetical protein
MKIECYTLEISEICQAQLADGHIARASYLQSHWHYDIQTRRILAVANNTTAIGVF